MVDGVFNVYIEKVHGHVFHKIPAFTEFHELRFHLYEEFRRLSEVSHEEWTSFFSNLNQLNNYGLKPDFGSAANFMLDRESKLWIVDVDNLGSENAITFDIDLLTSFTVLSKPTLSFFLNATENKIILPIAIYNKLRDTINNISRATGHNLPNCYNFIYSKIAIQ